VNWCLEILKKQVIVYADIIPKTGQRKFGQEKKLTAKTVMGIQ